MKYRVRKECMVALVLERNIDDKEINRVLQCSTNFCSKANDERRRCANLPPLGCEPIGG